MIRQLGVTSFFNGVNQVAIAVIGIILSPFIVSGLGYEIYGIYSVFLLILGVSALFDLGFGKALVKYAAEYTVTGDSKLFSNLFWFFFWVQSSIGVLIGVLLFFNSEGLTHFLFKSNFNYDVVNAFRCISFVIPFILLISSVRSVLEGLLFFKFVNLMKFILNSSLFLVPAVCLFFGISNLLYIVFFITAVRFFVFFVSFLFLVSKIPFLLVEFNLIGYKGIDARILKFTGWVALTNLIVPVIGQLDKLMLSTFRSPSEVTFYSLPLDLINGLYIIPNSIMIVLYPLFSKIFNDINTLNKIAKLISKILFIIMFPLSLLLSTFSFEILKLWQGLTVAINSKFVMQFISITIPLTAISWVYSNILLALGYSKILAFNLSIQLLIFTPLLYFSINSFGLKGATFIISLRLTCEALIYIIIANKKLGGSLLLTNKQMTFILYLLILFGPFIIYAFLNDKLPYKIITFSISFFLFLFFSWKYLLSEDEKLFLKIKMGRK